MFLGFDTVLYIVFVIAVYKIVSSDSFLFLLKSVFIVGVSLHLSAFAGDCCVYVLHGNGNVQF